jgi:type II secretory pathway pseudopilin PulG
MFTKKPANSRRRKRTIKSQVGSTLIEVVIALALLGIIGGTFLSALMTSTNSRTISSEHTAGRIIAASQMDGILNQPYSFAYDTIEIPAGYAGYTSAVGVDDMFDGNLQKITVTVMHNGKEVTKLESYKVIR